jgi:hypothetical protein
MYKIEYKGQTVQTEYIGDGVYALFVENGIWLHANDPFQPTDKIFLEPIVLKNLLLAKEALIK